MISNLTAKLKESLISVIPVMTIVLILNFTIAPLQEGDLAKYLTGGALLIMGLGIFLMGADIGMVPFGQKIGSVLTRKRNLTLLMAAAFAIGFAVTIAEPDVHVLADQVKNVSPSMSKSTLLILIACGIGFFLLVGAARVVLRIPLRRLLIVFYILVFIACAFIDPSFVGVAFDASGATTGPITVPFIMAMGIGFAAGIKKEEGDDSSFGMVGLASIGPIAAVAAMGLFSGAAMTGTEQTEIAVSSLPLLTHFLHLLPEIAYDICLAMLPLLLIFILSQLLLLRLPFSQVRRVLLGFIYVFIGLVLFMTGVNGGFSPVGQSLGIALASAESTWLLLPIGLVLGAVVVCAEPAVWVLTEQVEKISGGHIPRPIMLIALSVSIAAAVALGMLRVLTSISIWWMLLPGYALALALTFFCPRLFTAIAFDSGGVASGPMSTTFILSLTLGASYAIEGGDPLTDAFGMIAMIAMAPLITIQLLGLIFRYIVKAPKKQTEGQTP